MTPTFPLAPPAAGDEDVLEAKDWNWFDKLVDDELRAPRDPRCAFHPAMGVAPALSVAPRRSRAFAGVTLAARSAVSSLLDW